MDVFSYLMTKNGHNYLKDDDLFSYVLAKGKGGTYATFTGISINANNTRRGKMKLTLKGNTSQTGTPTPSTPIPVNVVSGDNEVVIRDRNFFNFNNYFSKSSNVTIDSSTTNTLKASVTTASTWQTAQYIVEKLEKNTNYTFWFNFANSNTSSAYANTYLSIKDGNGTNLFNNTYHTNDKITINTGNYDTLRFAFHITMGGTAVTNTITITQAQLEKGTTTGEYEPYQSQTYEVDLGTLELCKIGDYQDYFTKNSGKNLFDKDSATSGYYISDTGAIVERTGVFYSDYIEVKPSTTYCVSGRNGGWANISFYDSSKTFISRVNESNNLFTTTSSTYYIRANGNSNDLNSIMINEGSTALTYEPYGTGQWCKYNAIGKYTFTGSEALSLQNNGKRVYVNSLESSIPNILHTPSVSQTYGLYSNKLEEKTAGQTWGGTQGISYDYNSGANRGNFDISINGISTLEAYKTAIVGIIIYYILETPYLSLIEDTTLIEQLDNIENAMSYSGQTNINQTNNDLSANMEARILVNE